MPIWYHGTDKDSAEIILKEGFQLDTYFGKHMEDALNYGGDYIFTIFFKDDPTDYWEYRNAKTIPLSEIFMLYRINKTRLYYSKEVEHRNRMQFHEEVNPGKDVCKNCNGRGELGKDDSFNEFTLGKFIDREIIACSKCEGHGVLNYYEEA